jgi:hypothetical protein
MLLSLMPVGMNCVGDFREQTSVTKYHTILFSEYLHEPASTTPIWANNAAAQEQCQHPNIDKKPSID